MNSYDLRMVVWGTAIFSDDLAADTRDLFTDLLAEGLTAEQATQQLVSESADRLQDPDDSTVFWLALAATQWRLGRLTDTARDRAVQIIDSDIDLRRWNEAKISEINQRKKHLAKLRAQLLGPQPKPRKLKRIEKSTTDFQPGDVATFHLDEGISVRFCVLKVWGDRGGNYANICLLGIDDGNTPDIKSLSLTDTLGPHYTMLDHEPSETVTLLYRGVQLPEPTPETRRAWLNLALSGLTGHACFWRDFPDTLRAILPKLR
jgi:hypothetical protein